MSMLSPREDLKKEVRAYIFEIIFSKYLFHFLVNKIIELLYGPRRRYIDRSD